MNVSRTNRRAPTVNWHNLPTELYAEIFLNIFSYKDLVQSALVCRQWNAIISDPLIGRTFLLRRNLKLKESESWQKTYSAWAHAFNHYIALDVSNSMNREDRKILALNCVENLAKSILGNSPRGLTLGAFSSTYAFFHFTTMPDSFDFIYEKVEAEGTEIMMILNEIINWHTCQSEYPIRTRSIVHIVSDMDLGHEACTELEDRINQLTDKDLPILKLNFHKIGTCSKYFFKSIKKRKRTEERVMVKCTEKKKKKKDSSTEEPPAKKRRGNP